ncbi:Aromatic acid exporter family member 1 [Amycolatopsis tolypomycina]|uniref:Aromatic acid exporter family member 1 n=1 Tax=Amycolatopsis tolypomycina TaxID=208445 RepID=A0A1H4WP55_9PSEU|nr:Aromatic acid exporter family member 1 [Amycolatopsis tolypomycina]
MTEQQERKPRKATPRPGALLRESAPASRPRAGRFARVLRLTAAAGSTETTDETERHDRTPVGWLARALRVPGRERRVLVQSAKATLAATAAWLLATLVLHLPQPFLAPYAAVFLVEATVYRSLRGWIQQVGSVGSGVLLAAVAGHFIPWQAVALAAVVFLGLLAGSWRRFGDSGVWVGVTGMLVISYGTAREPVLLGDRLLETALGAAIGVAVNTLIFPPLYGERLAAAAGRLGKAQAALLETLSDLIRRDEPPEDLDGLQSAAQDTRSQVLAAEEAVGLTREGRMLNLRRGRPAAGTHHERPLRTLIGLWPALSQLLAAVRTTAGSRPDHPFEYPWPDAREALADLMHHLAGAVQAVAVAGRPVELDECRALLEKLEKRLVTAEEDGVPARLGLGTMTLPARLLVEQLEKR